MIDVLRRCHAKLKGQTTPQISTNESKFFNLGGAWPLHPMQQLQPSRRQVCQMWRLWTRTSWAMMTMEPVRFPKWCRCFWGASRAPFWKNHNVSPQRTRRYYSPHSEMLKFGHSFYRMLSLSWAVLRKGGDINRHRVSEDKTSPKWHHFFAENRWDIFWDLPIFSNSNFYLPTLPPKKRSTHHFPWPSLRVPQMHFLQKINPFRPPSPSAKFGKQSLGWEISPFRPCPPPPPPLLSPNWGAKQDLDIPRK